MASFRKTLSTAPTPPRRTARQYALQLLARREWSALEIESRLRQVGYDAQAAADALAFCQGHGLQSDQRFADSRTRLRQRQFGDRHIAHELQSRGVAESLVGTALAQTDDEDDRAWFAARAFHGKALDLKTKGRLWRFLCGRGFTTGSIASVCKRLQADCGARDTADETLEDSA